MGGFPGGKSPYPVGRGQQLLSTLVLGLCSTQLGLPYTAGLLATFSVGRDTRKRRTVDRINTLKTHTQRLFLTRQSDLKVHILKDHKRIARKILKKNGKQRRLAQILNSIIKLQ